MKKVIIISCICFILYISTLHCYKRYRSYETYQTTKKHKKNRIEVKYFIKQIDTYNSLHPRKYFISIPVYYINMDKDVERNKWMISQLSKNVSTFYRVPGVNGKLIKNKMMDSIPYNNIFIRFKNDFSELILPEIGCTLSHLFAIKTAFENGENVAIIMEDDIYIDITNILYTKIEELVQNGPKDWEIIQLVHIYSYILNKPVKKLDKYTYHLHKKGKYEYSACAYVINRKGMETILKKVGSNPFYLQKTLSHYGVADSLIYDSVSTFIINPSIVTPCNIDLDSTIHTDHTDGHIDLTRHILDEHKDEIFPNKFVCFIDKIFYINLDHRKDRRQHIETELDSFDLKYERFNAIKNKFGALGCYQSHLSILKHAKDMRYRNILILEDDFTFVVDKFDFHTCMTQLENIDFDVCMISYNVLKSVDCEYPFLKKVINAQTASGYIVNYKFLDKLISLLEYYMPYLEKTKNKHLYAIDMIWKKLQPESKWYHFINCLGVQREDYSDIENKVVNYKV